MSTRSKSLFSGMNGLIAALAGLVTVGVGLLTIGSTLGWFGGGDAKTTGSASTDAESGGTASGPASSGDAAAKPASPPQWDVAPVSIDFGTLSAEKEKVVTLKNTGEAPFSVGRPTVGGVNQGEFRAVNVDCGTSLPAGGSCDVKVQFVSSTGGTYSAKLVLPLGGGSAVAEVPLKAQKLL